MPSNTAFQITTDYPLPTDAANGKGYTQTIRALAEAPIGSSVLVPAKGTTVFTIVKSVGGSGWTTTRREADGVRVWKIAEPKATRS